MRSNPPLLSREPVTADRLRVPPYDLPTTTLWSVDPGKHLRRFRGDAPSARHLSPHHPLMLNHPHRQERGVGSVTRCLPGLGPAASDGCLLRVSSGWAAGKDRLPLGEARSLVVWAPSGHGGPHE